MLGIRIRFANVFSNNVALRNRQTSLPFGVCSVKQSVEHMVGDKIGVWMPYGLMSKYLQDELAKHILPIQIMENHSKTEFFKRRSRSIRAVVGNGITGTYMCRFRSSFRCHLGRRLHLPRLGTLDSIISSPTWKLVLHFVQNQVNFTFHRLDLVSIYYGV